MMKLERANSTKSRAVEKKPSIETPTHRSMNESNFGMISSANRSKDNRHTFKKLMLSTSAGNKREGNKTNPGLAESEIQNMAFGQRIDELEKLRKRRKRLIKKNKSSNMDAFSFFFNKNKYVPNSPGLQKAMELHKRRGSPSVSAKNLNKSFEKVITEEKKIRPAFNPHQIRRSSSTVNETILTFAKR